MFSQLPAWGIPKIVKEGPWITRAKVPGKAAFESYYPGIGKWPKPHFWKKIIRRRGGTLSVRLPGLLRSQYISDAHYEWYVPMDEHQHRYLQFLVTRARGLGNLFYRLRYFLYRRWLFHIQFNNQDAWMVELMPETSPERLFRPDVSITAWRRLCEYARGEEKAEISLDQQLREIHADARIAAEGDA